MLIFLSYVINFSSSNLTTQGAIKNTTTARNLRQVLRQNFSWRAQIPKELAVLKTDRPLYASYSSIVIKNLFLFRSLKVRGKS